jgi:trimethylamine:corrinoid methyltransferase-like protein
MQTMGGVQMSGLRPSLRLLAESDINRIIDKAWDVLEEVGVEIEDQEILDICRDHDFPVERNRVFFNRECGTPFITSAPKSFRLYGRDDRTGIEIGNEEVHYDPGSAAVFWLDPESNDHRRARSEDCKNIAQLVQGLDQYHIQSTSIVPSDVPEMIADCHRLIYPLVYCSKPVITGTFRCESYSVMRRMLEVISGGAENLRARPNAIFDCCPSPPLRWSSLTVSALVECAKSGIPAELVSMPLAGATAPVTLQGAVVQHTAESLSGIIIHQMFGCGSPIIWGGSPAAFDMRYGTPPMGSIETMMIDLAYAQVGAYLNLPTHAYMACSDSKSPDFQAGMETGIGAVLAVLGGINIVSGPGFLNYENTQSPEKLILDNEICRMCYRLAEGINTSDQIDSLEVIRRHAQDGKFLSDPTTRQLHKNEISVSGPTVYRNSIDQWHHEGNPDSRVLARKELDRILSSDPARLDEARTKEVVEILKDEAKRIGEADIVSDRLNETVF